MPGAAAHGRVAAIVSESTLAMSQLLAALLASEMAVSALPAVLPVAFPWAFAITSGDRFPAAETY